MSSLLDISVIFSLLLLLTDGMVSSQQSVYYFFYQQPAYPRDCKEALDSCHYQRSSGVYVIKPDGYQKPFEVYCDNTVDSGGWTIILRRHEGSVTFHRDWLDYKLGFGFLSQELWIGHEKLSFLTNQKMYELRIDITNSNGTSGYALYTFFRTSDDFSNYRLTGLGLYSGTLDNVYAGQNCEHQSKCGCLVDGVQIQEGSTHMFPGCIKSCSCSNGQEFCDDSYQCTTNEICQFQNNLYQCSCQAGYIRVGDNCIICPANEVYGTCTCEASCGNPQGCIPCTQGEQCYCPNGFYLNGQDCVPQEQCGCLVDGFRIPEGQSRILPACLKSCSCSNGQEFCDDSYQCTTNEICQFQNNLYQCSCQAGYIRVGDNCIICPANEVYGTCTCEASCGNPQGCIPCTQGEQCYCPNGFYLNGQDCVPQEQCGCLVDGFRIPEGQSRILPACLKSCSCSNGQEFCDDSYQCTTNEICQFQNNLYQCFCQAGYTRVGDNCIICPANEVYGTCTCQASCGNPQGCVPCTQGEHCYCPNGFYLNGQDCVPQEQCGCYNSFDTSILQNGETYVNSDCSQECTCNNDRLNCVNYECSPNAECRVQDGEGQCHCNEGYSGNGETCTTMTYTDCYDVYQAGQRQDGVYDILPSGWTGSSFNVSCNMTIDGGGWTVLQRRIDGSENFERNWNAYKNGFGTPGQELWLGNDKIHFLTNQRNYEVRMDMINLDGNAYFAKYSLFRIGDESSNYQLVDLGVYDAASTTDYDAMAHHRNQYFSTPDNDNDPFADFHCAEDSRSGWWYGDAFFFSTSCAWSAFNRPNIGTTTFPNPIWARLPGTNALLYTEVKIRPV